MKRSLDLGVPQANDPRLLEKIQRILPTVSHVLRIMNSIPAASLTAEMLTMKKRNTLTCLEFAYWALLHVDVNFNQQKVNMSATFRHIGQEVFKSLVASNAAVVRNRPRPVGLRIIREDSKLYITKTICLFIDLEYYLLRN